MTNFRKYFFHRKIKKMVWAVVDCKLVRKNWNWICSTKINFMFYEFLHFGVHYNGHQYHPYHYVDLLCSRNLSDRNESVPCRVFLSNQNLISITRKIKIFGYLTVSLSAFHELKIWLGIWPNVVQGSLIVTRFDHFLFISSRGRFFPGFIPGTSLIHRVRFWACGLFAGSAFTIWTVFDRD